MVLLKWHSVLVLLTKWHAQVEPEAYVADHVICPITVAKVSMT